MTAIELINVTKVYRRYARKKQFATLKSALLKGSLIQDLQPDETVETHGRLEVAADDADGIELWHGPRLLQREDAHGGGLAADHRLAERTQHAAITVQTSCAHNAWVLVLPWLSAIRAPAGPWRQSASA